VTEPQGVFLQADWRWLLMLNFAIEPSALASRVPPGTVLDDWNGQTYVSLVGFRFLNTRVLGLPVPFHQNFDELNLRFYVRRRYGNEIRRGVVFVKEIVPKPAIATVARIAYNENYVAMKMRHRIALVDGQLQSGGGVGYGWLPEHRWNRIESRVTGAPSFAGDGSEEQFITEHYWGYAAQNDGGTIEYQVEHPSWRVWQTGESEMQCDVTALYGPEFHKALQQKPTSAFVAEGGPIIVRKGVRML